VRDEGTGIAPADRERIWERYVRLEGRAARVGGTGIGLTIVRTVVERHGGRVWVEDAPGGGAQFMVELERMDGYDAMETAAPAEPSVAGSRENGTT
jgi:signal transduction histidine kinase